MGKLPIIPHDAATGTFCDNSRIIYKEVNWALGKETVIMGKKRKATTFILQT